MRLRNYFSACKIALILFVALLGCTDGNPPNVKKADGYPFDGSRADNKQLDGCSREEVYPGSTPPGSSGPEIIRCPLWADIDLSLYETIPSLGDKSLNWATVRPGEETDYWELRGSGVVDPPKAGEKCKNATNREACVVEFDALIRNPSAGFGSPTPPKLEGQSVVGVLVPPRKYIVVSNHGDSNRVWDTSDKLKVFLGTINSKEEAILLAAGHSFFEREIEKENGAIREVDGEYELIVFKIVRSCFPIQTNRYLIRIESSGELRVLREQIYRQTTNTCA